MNSIVAYVCNFVAAEFKKKTKKPKTKHVYISEDSFIKKMQL